MTITLPLSLGTYPPSSFGYSHPLEYISNLHHHQDQHGQAGSREDGDEADSSVGMGVAAQRETATARMGVGTAQVGKHGGQAGGEESPFKKRSFNKSFSTPIWMPSSSFNANAHPSTSARRQHGLEVVVEIDTPSAHASSQASGSTTTTTTTSTTAKGKRKPDEAGLSPLKAKPSVSTSAMGKGRGLGKTSKVVEGLDLSRTQSSLVGGMVKDNGHGNGRRKSTSTSTTTSTTNFPTSTSHLPSTSQNPIVPPTPSNNHKQKTIDEEPEPECKPYDGFGTVPDDVVYGLARVADKVRRAGRVVVVCGAGISTPHIPDFRSSTGLFKMLAKAKDPMNIGMGDLGIAGDVATEEGEGSGSQAGEMSAAAAVGNGLGRRRGFKKTESTPALSMGLGGKPPRRGMKKTLSQPAIALGRGSGKGKASGRRKGGPLAEEEDEDGGNSSSSALTDLEDDLDGDESDKEVKGGSARVGRGKRMTVGGVGGIRSGKELFDVRCLTDPKLLPAHHSLLNTLHSLSTSTPPTSFHRYLKTLDDESRLLRVYTQNIDGLEGKVGLDERMPVEGDKRAENAFARLRSMRGKESGSGTVTPANMQVQEEAKARSQHKQKESPMLLPKDLPIEGPRTLMESLLPHGPLGHASSAGSSIPSRESTPSAQESAEDSGSSLSEAEKMLVHEQRGRDGDDESRSMTPQAHFRPGEGMGMVSTPGSSRSVSTVKTDFSARFGFLRTDAEAEKRERSKEIEAQSKFGLPRCIPLHGVLATMDCTRCSYSKRFEDFYPLPAEVLPCPSCEQNRDERVAANQRARSCGVLRASVLLYNEPSKCDTAIGEVVERDVFGVRKEDRADLLIVAGTTLQIPGVQKIVKQLATALQVNHPDDRTRQKERERAAKRKRKRKARDEGNLSGDSEEDSSEGEEDDEDEEPWSVDDFPIRTVLLNRDPPSKAWEDTFDVWIQGDLQDFTESWVKGGPAVTPAAIERSSEWMWKKGARDRERFTKAGNQGVLQGNLDELDYNTRTLLGLSSRTAELGKKKKIELGLKQSEAGKWLDMQNFKFERPLGFGQLVSVRRLSSTKLVFGKAVVPEEEPPAISSPSSEPVEEEPAASPAATGKGAKGRQQKLISERGDAASVSSSQTTAVVSVKRKPGRPPTKKQRTEAAVAKKPAKKPTNTLQFKNAKATATTGKKATTKSQAPADAEDQSRRIPARADWHRAFTGSLSPPPEPAEPTQSRSQGIHVETNITISPVKSIRDLCNPVSPVTAKMETSDKSATIDVPHAGARRSGRPKSANVRLK